MLPIKPIKSSGKQSTGPQVGLTNNYGSAIKNPVCKIRDMNIDSYSSKNIGKAPKSLA
jgi:hypothetical protein